MTQNNDLAKRDAIIRDRLWQMKKAAIDIMNLINLVSDDGATVDCDGVCEGCILENLGTVHCSKICDIEIMNIPEA